MPALPTAAVLTYTSNPTGVLTAAALATLMQNATLIPASLQEMLGVTLTSQVGSAVGGQAVLTVTLNTTGAFRTRFPSTYPGSTTYGPLGQILFGRLRAVINQTALASAPAIS